MKRTILLADDSPTIQRLVTQTFADASFDVVSVSNGDAAIKKFEDVRPDLVLADIFMPGKNGYEVCAHVRKHAFLSETPVVLLVGAFDAFDEAVARQAGASSNITKPFEPQALVDLVVSLLPDGAPAPAPEAEEAVEPEPVAQAAAAPAFAAMAAPHVEETVEDSPVVEAPVLEMPASEIIHAAAPAVVEDEKPRDEAADLLGLEELFKPEVVEAPPSATTLSDAEIERIADRVIQKLSTQVIESIAWDIVPEITAKVLREELKRNS